MVQSGQFHVLKPDTCTGFGIRQTWARISALQLHMLYTWESCTKCLKPQFLHLGEEHAPWECFGTEWYIACRLRGMVPDMQHKFNMATSVVMTKQKNKITTF